MTNMRDGMMTRISTAMAERLRNREDERGAALLSTLLFMVLLSGVSLVLLSVLLGQIGPAYVAQKSTRTVYAAQGGLQAGLGVIRTAAAAPVAGVVWGNPALLPCTFNGNLDGVSSAVGYAVRFSYFAADPTGKSDSWKLSNRMSCPMSSIAEPPKFALVVSEGTATAVPGSPAGVGNRTLTATYKFKVSNENVPGGRIWDASRTRCLEKSGTDPRFVAASQCVVANNANQLWVYDSGFQIKLASSTVGSAIPQCITDRENGTNTADAKLDNCLTGADRWRQLWSWVGGETWMGQKNPISAGPSTRCLAPPATTGNDRLQVRTNCSGSLAPEAAVGAGAAGKATNQIVNFKEFGRCADVTNENINYSFMITYPCKQDPSGTGAFLKWNHKWYYSEPIVGQTRRAGQQVFVNDNNGVKKCLQTPIPAAGVELEFKVCNTSLATQAWTRYSETGDALTSYTFVDTYGRCLAAEPVTFASPDTNLNNVASKMRMQPCDRSTAQKWNAPASYTQADFGSFSETAG